MSKLLQQSTVLDLLVGGNKLEEDVLCNLLRLKRDNVFVAPRDLLLFALYWHLVNSQFTTKQIQYIFLKCRNELRKAAEDIWDVIGEQKTKQIPVYQFVIIDKEYVSWSGTRHFFSLRTGETKSRLDTPIESTSYNLVEVVRRFFFAVEEESAKL